MTDIDAVIAAANKAGTGLRRVLETDRYDDADWKLTQKDMPKLEHIAEQLAEKNWTGPTLMEDVFGSLHKGRPQLHDTDDVALTHRVNREVLSELMDDAAWRELREYTVGDTFGAGLALATMSEQLRSLYEKLTPAQDAADEAEKAQQELDEEEQRQGDQPGGQPGDGPGTPGGGAGGEDAQGTLDRLRQAAADAARAADDALDKVRPSIGRATRMAAAEAAAEATDLAEAASGWGLTPGRLGRTDPAERQRLARLISSERMRRIAELVGRMRNMIWGEQSTRFDLGPDELHDVILSDNLRRLTSAERRRMAMPELEDMFWLRYSEKKLLTYELRETRREAKGPIVYVEDNSLSMKGDREMNARSVGLALLDIAVRQDRRFTAIIFSGPGSFKTFDFDPASRDTNLMLDYAGATIYGGTDFEGPLDAALAMLDADLAATGRSEADIVFATDGEANVSKEWMANWNATRERIGFTCYGLNIGGEAGGTLHEICDARVADVHRLIDGDDTRDIFRSINTDTRKESN